MLPNASFPILQMKLTRAPARAAATAWFEPLPPGPIEKLLPAIVSPIFGKRLATYAASATNTPRIQTSVFFITRPCGLVGRRRHCKKPFLTRILSVLTTPYAVWRSPLDSRAASSAMMPETGSSSVAVASERVTTTNYAMRSVRPFHLRRGRSCLAAGRRARPRQARRALARETRRRPSFLREKARLAFLNPSAPRG